MQDQPAEPEKVQLDVGTLILKKKHRLRVTRKIGEGGFGALYAVTDENTDTEWAMKCEPAADDQRVLKIEVQVLRLLSQSQARHACAIHSKGRHNNFHYLVMTLLGKSVSEYRKAQPHQRFSLSTTLRVGRQSLEAIEDLHKVGFLHRDLKPANFAVGRVELRELGKVYMIDFGMCRAYRNTKGNIRYPRMSAHFRGTVRYAPLSTHDRKDMSRKDDLETWVYMLVEMTTGRLPWSSMSDKNKVRDFKRACRTRGSSERHKLFSHGVPHEYETMLSYVDALQFWDAPDFEYVYRLLDVVYGAKYGKSLASDDRPLDWETSSSSRANPQMDKLPMAMIE